MTTRQHATTFNIPDARTLSKFVSFLGDMLDEIPQASNEGYMVAPTRLTRDATVTWGKGVPDGRIDLTIWQAHHEGFEVLQ